MYDQKGVNKNINENYFLGFLREKIFSGFLCRISSIHD